jgi:uncharacterized membrane protein
MEFLKEALHFMVDAGATFLELIGVCIVIIAGVRALIGIFTKDEHLQLKLAKGISLALTFKLGGEVLHTVTVSEWQELITLGAVILFRGVLTFMLHMEIKAEEAKKP